MDVNQTLYLETTILSYLAARPSRDLIVAAHQQITYEWWHESRAKFNLFISEAVIDEIKAGDKDAATRRLAFTEGLPMLKLTDEIEILSVEYHDKLGLPQKAQMDVIHLAYVVAYEIAYLLTWNCSHLANGLVIQRLQNLVVFKGNAMRTHILFH